MLGHLLVHRHCTPKWSVVGAVCAQVMRHVCCQGWTIVWVWAQVMRHVCYQGWDWWAFWGDMIWQGAGCLFDFLSGRQDGVDWTLCQGLCLNSWSLGESGAWNLKRSKTRVQQFDMGLVVLLSLCNSPSANLTSLTWNPYFWAFTSNWLYFRLDTTCLVWWTWSSKLGV